MGCYSLDMKYGKLQKMVPRVVTNLQFWIPLTTFWHQQSLMEPMLPNKLIKPLYLTAVKVSILVKRGHLVKTLKTGERLQSLLSFFLSLSLFLSCSLSLLLSFLPFSFLHLELAPKQHNSFIIFWLYSTPTPTHRCTEYTHTHNVNL